MRLNSVRLSLISYLLCDSTLNRLRFTDLNNAITRENVLKLKLENISHLSDRVVSRLTIKSAIQGSIPSPAAAETATSNSAQADYLIGCCCQQRSLD